MSLVTATNQPVMPSSTRDSGDKRERPQRDRVEEGNMDVAYAALKKYGEVVQVESEGNRALLVSQMEESSSVQAGEVAEDISAQAGSWKQRAKAELDAFSEYGKLSEKEREALSSAVDRYSQVSIGMRAVSDAFERAETLQGLVEQGRIESLGRPEKAALEALRGRDPREQKSLLPGKIPDREASNLVDAVRRIQDDDLRTRVNRESRIRIREAIVSNQEDLYAISESMRAQEPTPAANGRIGTEEDLQQARQRIQHWRKEAERARGVQKEIGSGVSGGVQIERLKQSVNEAFGEKAFEEAMEKHGGPRFASGVAEQAREAVAQGKVSKQQIEKKKAELSKPEKGKEGGVGRG